jgi:hypothetical protein
MTYSTQGPSTGPIALAIAAFVAAAASIGLAAGNLGAADERVTTGSSVRNLVEKYTESHAKRYERVVGPVRALAPAGDPSGNDIGSSTAFCPSGRRVVSGGHQAITGGGEIFYSDALTSRRVGWAVGAVNNLATSGTVQAFAYCVSSGRTAPAGNRRTLARQRAAVRREANVLVNRYRAFRASQRSAAAGL